MELVDTHCHIQSAGQGNGERTTRELWAKSDLTGGEIVENAEKVGVSKLICVGCELDDSKLAIEFVKNRPNCWCSIGIHPHEAKDYAGNSEKLAEFAALVAKPKIVAIGECGLDYFYNHSPKEAQIEILKFQLELALKSNLPVTFHVREAFDDFWPVFESFSDKQKIRGVLHSFTDNQANLERAIAHGLFIGVNGIATFAKDPGQLAMYKAIPLENLLPETDSPFLAPVPLRGSVNQPMNVKIVAEFLSDLRGESLEKIASATTKNAEGLFKL